MYTGVQDYYEMRWTLRAIRKELGLTPAGENVKISINRLTNGDADAPPMDTIRKCIRLLESEGAFKVEKKYIEDPSEVYDPPDTTWERATSFELAVKQDTFDLLCKIRVDDPRGPIDLKSDDVVHYKEEKTKIGAIKHLEDHKIELTRWLEIKSILDAIHRQLSPMGGNNQIVGLNLRQTHRNISQTVLEDLLMRGICGYGGGARTPDEERFYYLRGSLIEVRDIARFNRYRDGVSDFVKWIEQDAVRFSITGDYHKEPVPQKGASNLSLASQRKLKLLEILKEEWELTPKTDITIGKAAHLVDHPAGVSKVHWDTFTEKWIPRALLDSHEQFENLLNLFMSEGLIRWRTLDNIETIIEIKFPDDFESRYESCTLQILGSKENAKAAELGNKAEVGEEKVSIHDVNGSVSIVAANVLGKPPFATKPDFDESKPRIIWNGHPCEIPINENSHLFCKKMFGSEFGERVGEFDISEQDGWDNASSRSVYNAMQWVNGLIKKSYGIEVDLFKTRKSYYWIRDELFKLP